MTTNVVDPMQMYLLSGKDLAGLYAERDELRRRLNEAGEQLAEYRRLWGDTYARRSSAG